MSTPKNPSISLLDVGLDWPDGQTALSGITATFSTGSTGLVGANGSGKSTLLRLIAGRLEPTRGRIETSGEVDYLAQSVTLDVGATVADLLGITPTLLALRAIESGDVSTANFDTVGDDWDIESRAGEALRGVGLGLADLDRPVGAVSGGEAVLAAIAGVRLRRAPVALLDEPTNNLDRRSRETLYDLVRSWPGTLVVVSHDVALLRAMQNTAEMHDRRLTVFGGPYDEWRQHLDDEQAAATQAARTAQQAVKAEKRQRVETQTKLAHRARGAQKANENRTAAKIVMNQKASDAQVSAGKLRTQADDKVRTAQAALDAADARVRADTRIRVDLPDPDVPNSRRIADLVGTEGPSRSGGRSASRSSGPTAWAKPRCSRRSCRAAPPNPGVPGECCTPTAWATSPSGSTASTTGPRCSTPFWPRRRGWRRSRCATGSRASCCAVRRSSARSARSREASGSGSRSPGCCSPIRRRNCSCSTNRPTASTCRASTSSSTRCAPIAAR